MVQTQPLFRGALLVVICFLGAACATVEPATPTVERVWPQAPDTPVISYVRNFSEPKDMGRKKGFFRRAVEFLVGKEEPPVMLRPVGVSVDKKGRIYVPDTGLQAVHIYDFSRKKYRQIFWVEKGRSRLLAPVGVVIGKKGLIFVSDSRLNRIFVYNPKNLKLIRTIGDDQFERVTGLAYDPERDRLYAVDTKGNAVYAFNSDGQLLHKFGVRGEKDGEFNLPTHITVDGEGRLYITDSMNFRVQIFSPEGVFEGKVGKLGKSPGSFSKPKGVAVDSQGHIYVVDGVYDTVQIFDLKGNLLLFFGQTGEKEGDFWLPGGIAIDGEDRIYVANTYNQRVEVFKFLGDPAEN
ncbi:MAG TPA: 6-bladed beta-propeller [Nitrospiria bacterium]